MLVDATARDQSPHSANHKEPIQQNTTHMALPCTQDIPQMQAAAACAEKAGQPKTELRNKATQTTTSFSRFEVSKVKSLAECIEIHKPVPPPPPPPPQFFALGARPKLPKKEVLV